MDAFFESLMYTIKLNSIFLLVIGTVISFVFGLLPGLSGTEAMLLMLPFTFGMELNDAMLLLLSAYAASFVGGSITSIMFGVPGSPSSVTTCFDGFPLRKQGKAFYAIGAAASSSAFGGLFSLILVALLMPLMLTISLMFGPPEWFGVILFGLFVLAFAEEGRFARSLSSGLLGILISFMGLSTVTGDLRYTFGIPFLWGGIAAVPVFLGFYPLAEAVNLTFTKLPQQDLLADKQNVESDSTISKQNLSQMFAGACVPFKKFRAMFLGSLIGWIIGVIPGVGGALANTMGYVLVKQTSKNPETFGKGNIEGIIGAETANNASVGGALIPCLAVGIPGSLNTAILLGVLLIHGVKPGTNVFAEHIGTTWIIILAAAFGTILSSLITILIAGKIGARVLKIEIKIIIPIIVMVSSIAAYTVRNQPMDILVAYIFAFIGYAFKRYHFSRLTFVVAIMLGSVFESSYFQALAIGRGTYKSFYESPVLIAILIIMILFGVYVVFRSRIKKRYSIS